MDLLKELREFDGVSFGPQSLLRGMLDVIEKMMGFPATEFFGTEHEEEVWEKQIKLRNESLLLIRSVLEAYGEVTDESGFVDPLTMTRVLSVLKGFAERHLQFWVEVDRLGQALGFSVENTGHEYWHWNDAFSIGDHRRLLTEIEIWLSETESSIAFPAVEAEGDLVLA